jgi:hypothetical protein
MPHATRRSCGEPATATWRLSAEELRRLDDVSACRNPIRPGISTKFGLEAESASARHAVRRLTLARPGVTIAVRASAGIALAAAVAIAAPVLAHPVPFSYIDLRVGDRGVDVAVVAHVFDLAHDLGIDPPERLLDAAFTDARSRDLITLLASRFRIGSNGRTLECRTASAAEVCQRQSVAVRFTAPRPAARASSTFGP